MYYTLYYMTRSPTIEIHQETYDRLNEKAQEKQTTLKGFVNELLLLNLEKDEFLSKYAPMIQYIGITDNKITLRDSKKNQLTDVFKKNNSLYCTLDDSTDCIHIHYVLALPELGKI